MLSLGIKRIYVAPAGGDGVRVLVDRLWPRGLTREAAAAHYWARDIAPSNELRKWYSHDPAKWPEFRRRYFTELDANVEAVQALRERVGSGPATLLFQSKEEELNNAAALLAYLRGGKSSTAEPSATRSARAKAAPAEDSFATLSAAVAPAARPTPPSAASRTRKPRNA